MKVPHGRVRWIRRRRETLSANVAGDVALPGSIAFGAATSSHQVEGGDVHSDWWRYERLPGKVAAFHDQPEFLRNLKCDHWRRFDDDVRLMKSLGLQAYRFSIDWSRCEPEPGRFDEAAIDRYAAWCATLRAAGIRPCVTLFHWSSPDWIWDHGRELETGWYDPAIVNRFTFFVRKVVPRLAPHVDLFCTLNEPNIFLYGGFSEGLLCPGHRREDDRELFPVVVNLLRSHVAAYRAIKEVRPDAEVGLAHQFAIFEPQNDRNPLERVAAASVEHAFTWMIPDALATGVARLRTRSLRHLTQPIDGLAGSADFMGVNWYERTFVRLPGGFRVDQLEVVHDHRGDKAIWPRECYDAGFLEMLGDVHARYGLPLYVTENGRAHPDDAERELFLRRHLRALGEAVRRGVDVRGYFWWSLLDNQEWANGFAPKLGLFAIDPHAGERSLRGTGRAYAEAIRTRRV